MRAEQILAVLMDDQKYKAKVDELSALLDKLSEVRKIAATVEIAEQLVAEADAKVIELDKQLKDNKEEHRQVVASIKAKALEEANKAATLVSKERQAFADAGGIRAKAEAQIDKCAEIDAFLKERLAMVGAKEVQLNAKEQALEEKILKIKEACNA